MNLCFRLPPTIVLLLLVIALSSSRSAISEQPVPQELLHCMPVLIRIPLQDTTNASYGTGIILATSNGLFLVTAAHCIFDVSSTNTSKLINSTAHLSALTVDEDIKLLLDADLLQLQTHGLIKRHLTHDVAVLRIATIQDTIATPKGALTQWIYEHGVVANSAPHPTMWSAATQTIRFNDVPDASDVYILGYPIELLGQQSLNQVDFSSPLCRRGIVSQKNKNTGKLIIDSGVYGGNSGGPVVVLQHTPYGTIKYMIAGLITQYVPYSTRTYPQEGITNSVLVNSGYGVAEPIDYALELMLP